MNNNIGEKRMENEYFRRLSFIVLVLCSINAIIAAHEAFDTLVNFVYFLKVREFFESPPLNFQSSFFFSLFFFFVVSILIVVSLSSPLLVYFGVIKNIKAKNWNKARIWADFIWKLLLITAFPFLIPSLVTLIAYFNNFLTIGSTTSLDTIIRDVTLFLQGLIVMISSLMLLHISRKLVAL